MMADSNPLDARKLADSIDSSSPWQDAKNDTKKLEAEAILMEFDTLDVGLLLLQCCNCFRPLHALFWLCFVIRKMVSV
jgi:hypothetical protein